MKLYLFATFVFLCSLLILVNGLYISSREGLSTINDSSSSSKGYDTKFHDSIEDIREQSNAYIPVLDKVKVKDINGKETEISIPKNLGGFTYNRPGTFKYSADAYIPDYQDGVYLSKSIGVVPKNKSSAYLASNAKELKSEQTPYEHSGLMIPSIGTFPAAKSPDNVKGRSESDFQVTYAIPKTDEQIAYENRVANLLKQQNKIRNYVTPAPLNRQATLTKQKTTRPQRTTATPVQTITTKGPMIRQKSKKDAYRMETADSVSKTDLLKFSSQ
jgi:hypothetical protein